MVYITVLYNTIENVILSVTHLLIMVYLPSKTNGNERSAIWFDKLHCGFKTYVFVLLT